MCVSEYVCGGEGGMSCVSLWGPERGEGGNFLIRI